MKRFSLLLLVALAMVLTSTVAFADDGPFQIQIVSNLPTPTNLTGVDAAVHMSNSGGSWGVGIPPVDPARGYICANVYVFDAAEEELTCCSCLMSPNSIHGYDVATDLDNNTLTGLRPSQIVIKIVATEPAFVGPPFAPPTRVCDPTATNLRLVSGLIAQTKVAGGVDSSFENATQNSNELSRLRSLCAFNITNGTGPGVCGQIGVTGVNSTLCVAPPTI